MLQKKSLGDALQSFLKSFQSQHIGLILVVIILMLLNWSIEALKWRLLIKKMQPITFWESLKGVLCGITVGTFTPNRVGEFGGRILYLQYHQRIKGVVVTLVGSFGQIMVTVTTGLAASYIFILKYLNIRFIKMHEGLLLKSTLLFSISLLIAFFLIVYFNLNLLDKLIQRIPYLRKIKKYFAIVSAFGYVDLLKLLLLSYFRFAVFACQFYLLILAFDIHAPMHLCCLMICMIFFVQTVIPTLTIAELGVRGSVSQYFFSYIIPASQNLGIVYASSFLWVINLIIPAIAGAIFLLRKKFEN